MSANDLSPEMDDLVFDEAVSEKKQGHMLKQEKSGSSPSVSIRLSAAKGEVKKEISGTNDRPMENSEAQKETPDAVEELSSLPVETPPGTFRRPLSSLLTSESAGTFVFEPTGQTPRLMVNRSHPPQFQGMKNSNFDSAPVSIVPQVVGVGNEAKSEASTRNNSFVQDLPNQTGNSNDDSLKISVSHSRPVIAEVSASENSRVLTPNNPGSSDSLAAHNRGASKNAGNTERNASYEMFETLLASAVKGGASDLLLKQGQVPMFRWNGELFASRNGPRVEARFFDQLVPRILNESHLERLKNLNDVDISIQSHQAGRIRINVFRQRGEIALVARIIPIEVPTIERLDMEQGIRQLLDHKRGLILVTGATGSGKSTTVAAMLDFINSTRTSHVITIEDPIEFIHKDKRSMFSQRELGLDTKSYAEALKSALRQAPDVIFVGELRDGLTTEIALQAAETGHLVLSTLHTNDAADSLLRIIGMMGHDKEAIVRAQLADSLRGIVSQRLVKRRDRAGRIAAQEIMINTATIREKLIKGGHPTLVRDMIKQGGHSGMQSFDQHLLQLVKAGVVEYDEAYTHASNREDFALLFNGVNDGRQAS